MHFLTAAIHFKIKEIFLTEKNRKTTQSPCRENSFEKKSVNIMLNDLKSNVKIKQLAYKHAPKVWRLTGLNSCMFSEV